MIFNLREFDINIKKSPSPAIVVPAKYLPSPLKKIYRQSKKMSASQYFANSSLTDFILHKMICVSRVVKIPNILGKKLVF